MEVVLTIHSLVRWLILPVAIIALGKFGLGWLRGGAFGGVDRGLAMSYSTLLDVQMLLGLVLLFGEGFIGGEGFPMYRLAHAVIMVLAVIAGHLPARWRQATAAVRYRTAFAAVAGSLVLIFVGITVIVLGSRA